MSYDKDKYEKQIDSSPLFSLDKEKQPKGNDRGQRDRVVTCIYADNSSDKRRFAHRLYGGYLHIYPHGKIYGGVGMNISEIYSAMGLKVKLNYENTSVRFTQGALVRIAPCSNEQTFMLDQYGEGVKETGTIICKAGRSHADYLHELFAGEYSGAYKCMFVINGISDDSLEIQTYTFRTVTDERV